MVIIAWNQSGSLAVIFDADVFKSVLSIFITAAILNALRATLDIVLTFCVVVMPVAYSKSVQDPAGVLRFFSNLGSVIENESLYYYCVAIYLIPEILAAFLFFFPFLRGNPWSAQTGESSPSLCGVLSLSFMLEEA
ncbi:hypothetical protein K7X08_020657 [Anisodus acutangulus]|uniref:Uncharacterized protein n=1 Tax=Anisodus acutangulus TaxID=402998 RepID=A0A9Q1MSW0_9SOLA|nr:hypothetical protein K7X08_020657 [Anisodus acutangulus]